MLRRAIALTLLAACGGASANGQNPETIAERSQTQARTVLDRAVEAIGGAAALRDIEVVRLKLEGQTWPRMQMTTPAPPFEAGSQKETLLIDFKNNRMLLEQQVGGAGFEGHNTVSIKAGEGVAYDHRAHTATPIPAAQSSQQQFVQYYRRIPNLLLRQAIDRTNTLRYLGADTVNGKPHEAFTFVMPDTQQVAVYVDNASGLVSKYELIFTDPLTGDEASEILFGDYVAQGKYRVPTTWQWRQAGDEISKFRLQVEINPAVTEESFAANHDYPRVDPAPTDFKQEVENLGGGVYVVHNVAGQNQNSMAVEFKDHIVVVEAPGSSDGADQVIARIKETIPNKPIRYVAMTHHHGDHIGGLRSFIAEGATVITTQANRATVEAMAAAPQVDRLAKNPRKPEFLFIERGKRVLSDATQRLEFLDIGPNPHAKEMVIAYLPKQKIVFQGDLFFAPQNDAPQGPPQAGTVHFAKRAQELRLQIDRIAGVHGRTASAEEFTKAMKQTS